MSDEYVPHPPSEREMQVITLVARGLGNKEIGKRLFLAEYTIKTHVSRLMRRYHAKNRAHLVAIAFRKGWAD